MRRLRTVAIALAIACGWAGVANATSHGMMPMNISFGQMVLWQLVHFRMHIDFVFAALMTSIASPRDAWTMLVSQVGCAGTSPWTAFLFGSPGMSLLTFFATIGTPIALFYFALRRAIKMLGERAPALLPLLNFDPRLNPA